MTSLLETYTLHILNAMRKFGIEMKEKGLHVCDKSEREIVLQLFDWSQFFFGANFLLSRKFGQFYFLKSLFKGNRARPPNP